MLAILLYLAIGLALLSIILLLASPAMGLPVLLLAKPVIDTAFYQELFAGFSLTVIVGAVIPSIVILYMFFSRGYRSYSRMPLRRIWTVYGAYVLFFSLIIVYSSGIQDGMEVFFRHINGLVGFYMFQALVQTRRQLRNLCVVLVVAGLFPMLTTLYQVITGTQWHHLAHMRLGGLTRSSGLYYHVLTVRYYAYQTLIGILLSLEIVRIAQLMRLLLWGFALLAVFIIFNTYSKAGFLAMAVWVLCWTLLQKKFLQLSVISVLGALVLLYNYDVVINAVYTVFYKEYEALSGTGDTQIIFQGRLFLWESLMDEWLELGILSKTFSSGYLMTGAHNDHIQMLFHGGLVGIFVYLWLLAAIGFRLLGNLRRKIDPVTVAGLMLYLTFLIDTMGLVPSSYPHFQWLVWGVVGLGLRLREEERKTARAQPTASPAVVAPSIMR